MRCLVPIEANDGQTGLGLVVRGGGGGAGWNFIFKSCQPGRKREEGKESLQNKRNVLDCSMETGEVSYGTTGIPSQRDFYGIQFKSQ